MPRYPALLLALVVAVIRVAAAPDTKFDPATTATNQLGLELFRALATENPRANLLISPYSIQSALTLVYAGAAGDTRKEMARAVHFPDDDATLRSSFGALSNAFDQATKSVAAMAQSERENGAAGEGFELRTANRLYAQSGLALRDSFLEKLRAGYGAALEPIDFRQHPDAARATINGWVEQQTRRKIRDLIPANGVTTDTRLVLVNALYFKSSWETPFVTAATTPLPFRVSGSEPAQVPTMHLLSAHFSHAQFDGFSAVTLPYKLGAVQLVILLPDESVALAQLAARLNPETFRKLTPSAFSERPNGPRPDIDLFLPRFKIEGPTISLANKLKALGLKKAFDEPAGSANFDNIAPSKPGDDFALSEVLHKTFLALDENGTEAAAATVVTLRTLGVAVRNPAPPIIVHVDRPFLFAIQHCESGAVLFLGRVTDPR